MAELPAFATDMTQEDAYTLLQAIASAAGGHAGWGIPWRMTDYGDAVTYALHVKNTDGTNSRGALVEDDAGAIILRGNKAELRSDKPGVFGSSMTVGGTLAVTGAATLGNTLTVVGATALQSTLNVTGATALGSTLAVTGLATIGGTLTVTGAISGLSTLAIASTVSVNGDKLVITGTDGSLNIGPNKFTVAGGTGNTAIAGDLAVNTNKFTVAASSGNTLVAGTLNITGDVAVNTNKVNITASSGTLTIAGDFAVNASKFTITGSNGNTLCAGTMQITGATTLAADLTVDTNGLYVDAANNRVFMGYTTRAGSYRLNVNGPVAVDGTLDVFTGDVAIDNDKSYYGEDSGGTQRSLVKMTTTNEVTVGYTGGYVVLEGDRLGFFGASPGTKPDVSGSRGGNAALADLLTELATMGLITNSTTA